MPNTDMASIWLKCDLPLKKTGLPADFTPFNRDTGLLKILKLFEL